MSELIQGLSILAGIAAVLGVVFLLWPEKRG